MSYTTFVSVNKKSIEVAETDQEHAERRSRLRRAMKAQAIAEENKRTGRSPDVDVICPGCGSKKPMNNVTRTGNWCCKHCGWASKNWTNGPKI